MPRSWTPSIVPNGTDQTVYLVLNAFGSLGRAYCEASEGRSDLETTISDLMSGQYDNPLRVVAFNTAERWSEDVSRDIAREIMRRVGLAGEALPASLEGFVDSHLGPDRQLTLRSPDNGAPVKWKLWTRNDIIGIGFDEYVSKDAARMGA